MVFEFVDYLANGDRTLVAVATLMRGNLSLNSATLDLLLVLTHHLYHCCDFDCYCILNRLNLLTLGYLGWVMTPTIDNSTNINNCFEMVMTADDQYHQHYYHHHHQPLMVYRDDFRLSVNYVQTRIAARLSHGCHLN